MTAFSTPSPPTSQRSLEPIPKMRGSPPTDRIHEGKTVKH
jgi:hypothetical protein